jgi:SAM-dependent methyltransferase
MTTWSSGYVRDIPYTSSFYRELAPEYLRFVVLANAFHAPNTGGGATYCELGCGQGFGTALLAASNPGMRFWGLDFNPAQISNARRLAAETGLTNVTFEDWSFEQALGYLAELPKFDLISLHGIYSWVSPEVRRSVVEFIEHTLKPGGLVYVSYNSMPGWAAVAPLQRLMREHAERHPDRSDFQVAGATEFASKVQEFGALYFKQNAAVGIRFEKIRDMNRTYLAHEYMNDHWNPLYHVDVAHEMEKARLAYACSATISENVDDICIPATMMSLVQGTRDRSWQETLKDYASNKQFRRDVFLRGVSQVSGVELAQITMDMRFALIVPRSEVKFSFTGPLGQVQGQEEIYRPIADALAEKPQSMGELARIPQLVGRPWAVILQALSLLVHAGHVHPLSTESRGKSAELAKTFNRVVARRILRGDGLSFLAAPAIGTGIPVSYADVLGMRAVQENSKATPSQIASESWVFMQQAGQRLVKDGVALQTREETLPELEAQLTTFFSERLPLWRSLGVL